MLAVSSLSEPAQLLCGIDAHKGYVHVMYVYRPPDPNEPYDDSLALSFKLPVRDED